MVQCGGGPVISHLIFRVGSTRCALPLGAVVEVSRARAITPVPGGPEFVAGAARVRGAVAPVVDAARLLGLEGGAHQHWIVLRTEREGRVVLAVDAVEGAAALEAQEGELPPLLAEGAATALAHRDRSLLVVLEAARIVSGLPAEEPAP